MAASKAEKLCIGWLDSQAPRPKNLPPRPPFRRRDGKGERTEGWQTGKETAAWRQAGQGSDHPRGTLKADVPFIVEKVVALLLRHRSFPHTVRSTSPEQVLHR